MYARRILTLAQYFEKLAARKPGEQEPATRMMRQTPGGEWEEVTIEEPPITMDEPPVYAPGAEPLPEPEPVEEEEEEEPLTVPVPSDLPALEGPTTERAPKTERTGPPWYLTQKEFETVPVNVTVNMNALATGLRWINHKIKLDAAYLERKETQIKEKEARYQELYGEDQSNWPEHVLKAHNDNSKEFNGKLDLYNRIDEFLSQLGKLPSA